MNEFQTMKFYVRSIVVNHLGTLSTREVLCTIEEQSGTSLFSGNGNGIFSRFSSVVLLNRLANYSFIFFRHHPFTGKSNFAP